jgi:hypothetical protein
VWPPKGIANPDLTEQDLPQFTGEWDRPLIQFAWSFNGYEYAALVFSAEHRSPQSKLGTFANRTREAYFQGQSLPRSLSELRACLFFEQRKWHHLGSAAGAYEHYNADGKAMNYIRALLEAIASKVRSGEYE